MILVIILTCVCTVLLGIAFFSNCDSVAKFVFMCFATVISSVACFCVIFCVTGLLSLLIPENKQNIELEWSKNIIALKDNSSASGSFFIGSGYVNDELYYYYVSEGKHGYEMKKLEADQCYIIYDNNVHSIEFWEAKSFKNKAYNIFAIPTERYYVFRVPEGSITNEFAVDLE